MRFGDLPRGGQFHYQGGVWTKTGPLAARPSDGGAERLIPRSAAIQPTASSTPQPSSPTAPLSREAVRDAIGQLHDAAQRQLTEAGADTAARDSLTSLRDRLLTGLGLAP